VAGTKREIFSLLCGKKDTHNTAEKLIFLGEYQGYGSR
jgi:hypothetical protein